MNTNERVLGRAGARELSEEEVMAVTGAFRVHTLTPCVADRKGNVFAGDQSIGECG